MVTGVRSLAGPYIFCSVETAEHILAEVIGPGQTVYLLAKCKDPAVAPAIAERLRRAYPNMMTLTKNEFSKRTRWHWLVTTKTGIAVGGGALLALIVGAVVTSQTLFAATAASLKEYATLRALGIPRWRIAARYWPNRRGSAVWECASPCRRPTPSRGSLTRSVRRPSFLGRWWWRRRRPRSQWLCCLG